MIGPQGPGTNQRVALARLQAVASNSTGKDSKSSQLQLRNHKREVATGPETRGRTGIAAVLRNIKNLPFILGREPASLEYFFGWGSGCHGGAH
jgi:hypothetical protein